MLCYGTRPNRRRRRRKRRLRTATSVSRRRSARRCERRPVYVTLSARWQSSSQVCVRNKNVHPPSACVSACHPHGRSGSWRRNHLWCHGVTGGHAAELAVSRMEAAVREAQEDAREATVRADTAQQQRAAALTAAEQLSEQLRQATGPHMMGALVELETTTGAYTSARAVRLIRRPMRSHR
jgi:hypothetical protein